MRKFSLSILTILLLALLLTASAFAETEQYDVAAASTGDSIAFESFEQTAYDTVEYSVRVTVGADLADRGYGIGLQYSTNSEFNRSGQNIFFGQDIDRSVTYTDTCENELFSFTRVSMALVPGVTYYVRPVIIADGMGTNASVIGETSTFTALSDPTPFTLLDLDNAPTASTQEAATVFMRARFTAPADGLYVLDTSNFNFVWSLRENGSMISNSQSSPGSTLGMRIPLQLNQGQTVYFIGAAKGNSSSEYGTATIKPAADVAASSNSIHSSDPYSDSVTNTAMRLEFYVDATVDTAVNGYTVAVAFSLDPIFDVNTSRRSPAYELSHMPVSWTDHGDRTPATVTDFAPGTTVYYKAVLIVNGQIIAEESETHTVSFDSSLNGFTPLSMDTPFSWNYRQKQLFYFEAPSNGVYAMQVTGASSAMIRFDHATSMDRGSRQSSYLFGFYAAAGEKVFAYVENQNGNNCDITVYGGTEALPAITLGTQAGSTRPVWFQAPEAGLYQFSQDLVGADMNWADEYTGAWQDMGSGFEMHLPKGQIVWLFCTLNHRAVAPNLTVEQMPSLNRMVFPDDLTILDEEACAGNSMEEAVFVGAGLLSIGDRAFMDCTELDTVVFPIANVVIGQDAFQNCRSNLTLVAPGGGSVEQYAADHSLRFIPEP